MGAEEYIESLPMWATKKNTVQQVRAFLELLLQENKQPSAFSSEDKTDLVRQIPIVHVAGTNGKGSVCAYLTQAFLDSGLHTGTFISPHLVDVKERILLDNVPVDRARFEAACSRVKKLAETENIAAWPTYFEYLYYMAMCVFFDAKVDVIVLETGLGGRLDATNSCSPVLTVITSISLDHMQYLGDTTEKIAAEKAGIIKPGVPVVYDPNDEAASRVIRAMADKLGSASYAAYSVCAAYASCAECLAALQSASAKTMTDLQTASAKTMTDLQSAAAKSSMDPRERFSFLQIPYQRQNAATALKAWQVLRALPEFRKESGEACPCFGNGSQQSFAAGIRSFLESEEAFIESVRRTRWAARMQEIRQDVFLDGAHNEDGIRAFAEAAQLICRTRNKRPVLLTSAVSDKDLKHIAGRIAKELMPVRIYTAPLKSYRAADAGRIAELYREYGVTDVRLLDGIAEAFRRAVTEKQDDEILFCAGSLYMAGEILAEN
ncbi:MAG: hypothetical protein IJT43_04460 [Stomatobaculum sp.]|nr:hypothetical protein [Stomatobaculum sp.]